MQTPASLSTETPKQLPNQFHKARAGKNDARYWLPRLYRPTNDRGRQSPHYAMQLQYRGHRLGFGLHTSNREAAARRAAGIYGDLLSLGIEETLAKYRAKLPEAEGIATVGEYIVASRAVSSVRLVTFADYARHLRQIVGDIIAVKVSRKAKATQRRATRATIDATPLSVLSPEVIQAWRLSFLARTQGDAKRERSARTSCNSIIRQARALFAPKVVKFLGSLRLPQPLPFAGVEFFPRESTRYISRIDAGELLRTARQKLAGNDPHSFLVILLALVAGLRRGEIDQLLWANVDLDGARIIVDSSEHGRLKTPESHGAIDIDQYTVEILRGFRTRASSKFVIEAGGAANGSRLPWKRYRCEAVFECATWWLRRHGVEEAKPLHALRKESGSLIASQYGIFAASRHLRHRDIAVTAAHYADKKTRVKIDTASLLKADETEAGNIISLPHRKEKVSHTAASGARGGGYGERNRMERRRRGESCATKRGAA
jgi:integrase